MIPAPDEHCFLTDAEIIRRLHLPAKVGRRVLRELDKRHPGRRPFPQKDPLFGNRRFWPAVCQWLADYKMPGADHARIAAAAPPISWEENFDAPISPDEASQSRRARPALAHAK